MWRAPLVLTALLLVAAVAAGDGFQRERDGKTDARKNALEGRAPPALAVNGWMNTQDGAALKLADLKGKVIVLDFWGVW